VRFHDLRHTHASLLLANNVDAVAVASRLGHSDAETTLREYAHALRKRDLAAAEVMQQLFSAQQTASEDLGRLQSLHPTITYSPARKP
jgi:site-specific recombinase XerD